MFLKVLTGSYLFVFEELITKKIVYHLFEVEMEFIRYVFLSYLIARGNLFVLYCCDKDLMNLANWCIIYKLKVFKVTFAIT